MELLPNCLPNYQSIMNYLFQVRGLQTGLACRRSTSPGRASARSTSTRWWAAGMGPLAYRPRWCVPVERQLHRHQGWRRRQTGRL
jgi:hypothetical protein